MNKYFKAYGKGLIWGAKHPFREVSRTDRYDDIGVIDAMCDALGVATSQAVIAHALLIGGLIAIGYANNKIKNKPVNVKMVVDKKPEEKK